MQKTETGNYTAKQLMGLIHSEVDLAVDYISTVIKDYENTKHVSEHFSDVLMIENYVHNPAPSGSLRKSLRGRPGVYVFIVKEAFQLSYKEVFDYSEKCHGAGFPKYQDMSFEVGQHYYQGSALDSLLKRMGTHYSKKSHVSALQLNNIYRIKVKNKLKVFVFPVIEELKDEPFFIKMIEARLHKRFPAFTGSNRV